MHGIWRILILLIAPGILRGVFAVNGLLRVYDAPCEPLLALFVALAAGGVCWTLSACLARRLPCRTPELSVVDFLTLAALLIAPGALQRLGVPGPWMGLAEVLIVSASVPWALHYYPLLSGRDRNWRALGLLAGAAMIYCFIAFIGRLYFLESLYFWGGVILLLCFLWASPATRRGDRKRRWQFRGAMLFVLFLSLLCRPEYLYAPWIARPACMPEDAVWSGTEVTPFGSNFAWSIPGNQYCDKLFDARGRFIMGRNADKDVLPAIPGLLGSGLKAHPNILLLANDNTIWAKELAACGPDLRVTWNVPVVWDRRNTLNLPDSVELAEDAQAADGAPYDIVVLLAVPRISEFEGNLRRWLDKKTALMNRVDGLIAVPSRLLSSPVLMDYFHEHFAWCSVLPGTQTMWLFSNRPRNLAPAVIDWNLEALFGENSPLPGGVYEFMCAAVAPAIGAEEHMEAALDDRCWHAPRWREWSDWRWYAAGALLIVLWRMVRLLAERRGAGYRDWNLMENGFSCASWYFLYLAVVVSEFCMAPVLGVIWGALPAALWLSCREKSLAWLCLLLAAIGLGKQGWNLPCGWSLIVIALNAAAGGHDALFSLKNPANFRRELPMTGIGTALAAALMALATWLEAPVGAVIFLLLAARLPWILQKCRKSVY